MQNNRNGVNIYKCDGYIKRVKVYMMSVQQSLVKPKVLPTNVMEFIF